LSFGIACLCFLYRLLFPAYRFRFILKLRAFMPLAALIFALTFLTMPFLFFRERFFIA